MSAGIDGPATEVVYHLRPEPLIGATLWPLSELAAADTVLYTPRRYDPGGPPPAVGASDCAPYSLRSLAAASRIGPSDAARLYDPAHGPGLFAGVVHVLHRGPVPIDPERIVRA